MSSLEKKEISQNPAVQSKTWSYVGFALLALVSLWYLFSLLHPLYAINQDLGRFIEITKHIFETGSISSLNTFSYTYPEFAFVHSHWLGGVLLTALVGLVGLSGLVVVKAFMILGAFILALRLAYKRMQGLYEMKVFLLGLLSIPIVVMLLERTHARPEIFSHLFFVLVLAILYAKRNALLWIIPPLMLVWVNTHIYFLVGFLLIGAYFMESLYESRFGKRTLHLIGVGISSIIVSLLNPSGLQGFLYPFKVFENYGYTIVENQTPFFLIPFNYHHGIIATLFVMIVVLGVSFLLNWRKVKVSDVLVSLGLVYLSLTVMRNVALFALGAMPILAYNMSSIKAKALGISSEGVRERILVLLRISALVACVALIPVVARAGMSVSVSSPEIMRGAVEFVKEQEIEGNMFNNFDVGGYLIYTLYPERKVFVDNRPEAYPADFFASVYKHMQENADVWRETVERYDISYVIFGITDQTPWGQNFLRIITSDSDWSIVYLDSYGLVALRRDVEKNKGIIERYGKAIY